MGLSMNTHTDLSLVWLSTEEGSEAASVYYARSEDDEIPYAILLYSMDWRPLVAFEELLCQSVASINDTPRPRRIL